jgi:hypothetical protein
MNSIMRRVCNIAWALWFGGMIALLIFVQTLFRTDRAIAIAAAPHLFHAFENYQLALGVIAIASAIPVWISTRSRAAAVLLLMLAIALVLSIISKTVITPEIMRLRAAGETHGPNFGKIHGISMLVYTAQAVALLIGGLALPKSLDASQTCPRDSVLDRARLSGGAK